MHDKDIQEISVSVPGIINEGRVSLPGAPLKDLDMQKRLEEEFHLPVGIEDDMDIEIDDFVDLMEKGLFYMYMNRLLAMKMNEN